MRTIRRTMPVLQEREFEHATERHRLPGGLSPSGALSLLAVVAVLIVVSVPRLRGIALQENEVDARATAQLLAGALRGEAPGAAPSLRELLQRDELSGALSDAELLASGRILRRHGYLFELTRLPLGLSLAASPLLFLRPEPAALGPMPAVRAWPWKRGSTGAASFLVTSAGATLVRSDLPWEGPDDAGAAIDGVAGWQRVP
jgi:hypothetical protein